MPAVFDSRLIWLAVVEPENDSFGATYRCTTRDVSGGFGPAAEVQLVKDVRHVLLNRFLAEVNLAGDLAVGFSFVYSLQYFSLVFGQLRLILAAALGSHFPHLLQQSLGDARVQQ